MKNFYRVEDDEAANIMKQCRVIHPYGSIGSLPWRVGENSVQFGGDRERIDLLALARNIKTFTEQIEDDRVLAAIRDGLQMASMIVFLGFGFHRENLALMQPVLPTNAERIYFTTKGISGNDIEVVREKIKNMFGGGSFRVSCERGLTCTSLFDEYWRHFVFS